MPDSSQNALIVVVLMVKNEAAGIQSTLSSLFDGGIRHFFIFDTGSSDNTIECANAFFQQNNIDGIIRQETFIDFSTSRNRALTLAELYFSSATFFLMPDAEWQLHHAETLLLFCEKEKNNHTPLYLLSITMNAMTFKTARLFRADKKIRFKGVVHEAPSTPASHSVPDPVYFAVKASTQGILKTQMRWQNDLILLLDAYHQNPQDPRNTFYLSQTYECLGEFEKAREFYQAREKLNGWDEENFITLFRLGYLFEKNNWSIAMNYFLKAFSLRPHRIEPLVKIADYYWPSNIQTCYLFIRPVYDMPFPKNDLLFVEQEMYDYTRYEIMSRCAWYMGQYWLGEQATLQALKIKPNAAHLQKNLALYQEKLMQV